MDLGLIAAIVMLVVWAVLTFVVNDAPGMTHALLTAGVALLIWRIVKRGSSDVDHANRSSRGSS
jgi:threonine/homoserine/homoserine lactone efflux protein